MCISFPYIQMHLLYGHPMDDNNPLTPITFNNSLRHHAIYHSLSLSLPLHRFTVHLTLPFRLISNFFPYFRIFTCPAVFSFLVLLHSLCIFPDSVCFNLVHYVVYVSLLNLSVSTHSLYFPEFDSFCCLLAPLFEHSDSTWR